MTGGRDVPTHTVEVAECGGRCEGRVASDQLSCETRNGGEVVGGDGF